MNYGKLIENAITYAPKTLTIDGRLIFAPTASDYLSQGWKYLNLAAPTDPAPTGYHYEEGDLTETDTTITREWKTVEDPKVYRKFSKLKLYGAIAQLGAWDKVKEWLEAKDIGGVNGWMAFQLAQEVSEDNALFTSLADEARQLLGLDEATFETLLASCVLEG